MIRIVEVSKSFGGRRILGPINLQFDPEKTHVLLGASGSGKSTLLRMIMGLLQADTGEIWIENDKMDFHSQRFLAQKIGYVLQEGGLFPHMKAGENVTLVARMLNWSQKKIHQRLEELLETVGLEASVLEHYPAQLSGGQKQRVGIMRAAFLNPTVMLLDEPLGALDPIVRAHLQTELKSIFSKLKKLVVLVTHDIAEAAFLGETVTLIHQGEVLQKGSFQDLLNNPSDPYVTTFIQAQRTLHQWESAR